MLLTRRAMLSKLALGAAGVASGAVPLRFGNSRIPQPRFSPQDEAFLEEIGRASFVAFRDHAHPQTGLVKDIIRPNGGENISSIASTGFGLTALCIAAQRGWVPHSKATEQARRTLRFLWNEMPHVRGFYYHFVDWQTGERAGASEISSIDTAILICGALTCRQYFRDAEIQELAANIYDRVNWQWMYRNGPFLNHGWTPEYGFLTSQWDSYCEHMMLYLLAIGANRNPIPPEAWGAWRRPWVGFDGTRYIDAEAPLFIHQYSHAWFDFRVRRDAHADYFENSTLATRAHQRFCTNLSEEFPQYDDELWGITASASPQGYVIWGGPPRIGPIDGTVVPCAAGGSLPFLPGPTLQVLSNMRERYGNSAWGEYGFTDAFNPGTGWAADDIYTINTGITLLMAENARTGLVWDLFMRNPEARVAMRYAGFKSSEVFKSPNIA